MAASMRCDRAVIHQSGVTVMGHPDRAENHVTAGYELGEHFIVTCDPAVETRLRDATTGMPPTLTAWRECAVDAGGKFLGSGRMQLQAPPPTEARLPDGFSLRSLDRDHSDDFALIERLVESSDADDLDDAEIELDNLDAIIEVVVDGDGEIAAFSSGRPFEMAAKFGDIGIMTRPEHRGRGVGSAAVAALCHRLRAAGLEPLYRCDEDNAGSVKLSAVLGFEPVTRLVAYCFPVD